MFQNSSNLAHRPLFEGLKYAKRNLSDAEIIRHLNAHRAWCMRIIEIAAKRQMEARMLEDSQVSYTISFNIGDLVLLSRPKIGSRSKGTATRLLYQNIGPFEVVDKLSDVTYRLRKLGTDKVTSHHVKYINPYLTKQAYEAEVSRATSDEPANFNHTQDSKHPPQFLPR